MRKEFPTLSNVKAVIGSAKPSTARSLSFAAFDVFSTATCVWGGVSFLFPAMNKLLDVLH